VQKVVPENNDYLVDFIERMSGSRPMTRNFFVVAIAFPSITLRLTLLAAQDIFLTNDRCY